MVAPLVINDRTTELENVWQVTPLFSKPLCLTRVSDDVVEKLSKLCSSTSDWEKDQDDSGSNGAITKNQNILDLEPDLKNVLVDYSSSCLKGIVGYDTDIQITTSWFTKTERNGFCTGHVHQNSWWSGVVFFEEYYAGSSPLQFTGTYDQISPMKFLQPNYLNSSSWQIQPSRGMLVMFPSNVWHEVIKSGNVKTRYSLAYNVMPKGTVGLGDSTYQYQ